jgi:hypothetical protein
MKTVYHLFTDNLLQGVMPAPFTISYAEHKTTTGERSFTAFDAKLEFAAQILKTRPAERKGLENIAALIQYV